MNKNRSKQAADAAKRVGHFSWSFSSLSSGFGVVNGENGPFERGGLFPNEPFWLPKPFWGSLGWPWASQVSSDVVNNATAPARLKKGIKSPQVV